MKVLLINGSPHAHGCTYTALSEVAKQLATHGIDSEIVQVGIQPIRGCIGCGGCRTTGKCVFSDGNVNEIAAKAKAADALVLGSPVHYAAASGLLVSLCDRLFYSAGASLRLKPGVCVVSCRRGGASATFDQLNKYFTISQMPVVSSRYWNSVHGTDASEVLQDLEGMSVMRTLADNMAWLLHCIETGKQQGVAIPQQEPRVATNFIR